MLGPAEREALLDLAARSRLTNVIVRMELGVDAWIAEEILVGLVAENALVKRGRTRGTHYTLPER